MITLEQYLKTILPQDIFKALVKDDDPEEYVSLLQIVLIETTEINLERKTLLFETGTYLDFFESCIESSLLKCDGNIISSGILLVQNINIPARIKVFRETLQARFLKLYIWEILYQRIGTEKLAMVFLYQKGYITPNSIFDFETDNECVSSSSTKFLIQLFGKKKQIPKRDFISKWMKTFNKNRNQFNTVPKKKVTLVQRKHMFLSNKQSFNNIPQINIPKKIRLLIPASPTLLLSQIFDLNTHNKKKIRQKYGGSFKMLTAVVLNHDKKKHYYKTLFNKYCTKKINENQKVLSMAIEKSQIIKFILSIISMLFPMKETFGSSYNRNIIFSHISNFISLAKKHQIPSHHFLKYIKIKEIPWLLTKYCINSKISKQELQNRTEMFEMFIIWLFYIFINKIIGIYFHVTSLTNDPNLYYYFNQHDWKILQENFIKRYTLKFLYDVPSNNLTFGKAGIFPKPNDLRMLCFPVTKLKYKLKKSIKPIKQVLKHVRETKFEHNLKIPITSVEDVIFNLLDFNIDSKKIHFKKFDIKSCYDLLPRDKIFDILDKMIDDNDTFYLNKTTNLVSYIIKKYEENTKKNIENRIQEFNKGSKYYSRDEIQSFRNYQNKQHKTVFLVDEINDHHYIIKKQQIIQLVQSQIYDSSIKLPNGNVVSRNVGLFQGYILSSILCDYFFDYVVLKEIDLDYDISTTRLIRYADDFLIISKDELVVNELYNKITKALRNYEVFVNDSKTVSSSENINIKNICFVGLNIDISSLWGIVKNYKVPKSIPYTSNFKLFSHAVWIFETRLCDMLLDIKKNKSLKYVYSNLLNNIQTCCIFLIKLMKKTNLGKIKINVNEFIKWFKKFLKITFGTLNRVNGGCFKKKVLYEFSIKVLVDGFLMEMKKYLFCLKDIILWLNKIITKK